MASEGPGCSELAPGHRAPAPLPPTHIGAHTPQGWQMATVCSLLPGPPGLPAPHPQPHLTPRALHIQGFALPHPWTGLLDQEPTPSLHTLTAAYRETKGPQPALPTLFNSPWLPAHPARGPEPQLAIPSPPFLLSGQTSNWLVPAPSPPQLYRPCPGQATCTRGAPNVIACDPKPHPLATFQRPSSLGPLLLSSRPHPPLHAFTLSPQTSTAS